MGERLAATARGIARGMGAAGGAAAVYLACVAALGCGGGGRDVVPVTHEVHGDGAGPGAPSDYVHVARRPHGVVALAEARGLEDAVAARATERLADEFEACAKVEASQGRLVDGAGRVVAYLDDGGVVGPPLVRAAPGGAVAANLLLCVVAPLRQMAFPPKDDAPDGGPVRRGVAFEVKWSPAGAGPSATPGGADGPPGAQVPPGTPGSAAKAPER
jgi:hypothetical protein